MEQQENSTACLKMVGLWLGCSIAIKDSIRLKRGNNRIKDKIC